MPQHLHWLLKADEKNGGGADKSTQPSVKISAKGVLPREDNDRGPKGVKTDRGEDCDVSAGMDWDDASMGADMDGTSTGMDVSVDVDGVCVDVSMDGAWT